MDTFFFHIDCSKNKIFTVVLIDFQATKIRWSEWMVKMNDTQDNFGQKDSVMVEFDGRREQVTPLTFAKTMRSFNERIMKAQEDHNRINASILDSLVNIK